MNIKKQIRTLYIYEMISGLQIVDLPVVNPEFTGI